MPVWMDRTRSGALVLRVLVATSVTIGLSSGVLAQSLSPDVPAASPPAPGPSASGEPTAGVSETAQLQARVAQLQAAVDDLTRQLGAMTVERDGLRAGAALFHDLYDPMEADRLLLAELRKDIPRDRPEAEAYLGRVQRLALVADPARLGTVGTRVMDAAPAYLDWRGQQYASQQEASQAYLQSGAAGFDTSWTSFKNAILLTVGDHLDTVLTLVERAE